MIAASEQMARAGVRHALVGGLAVGAYGSPRATKDVDFLVGAEGFVLHQSGLVTLHPALPIAFEGVAVDALGATEGEEHLEAAIDRAAVTEGVPVVPVEALVYLKLRSPRLRDQADVARLVEAGIDRAAVERYLDLFAPDLHDGFLAIAEQVEREQAD